ncbi:MAG: transcriptional regulator, AraC family [Flaviaesturariibacter sp.]|nr:transcriptional regulator, AraC family [Flaviaesturariibacter sp.]
MVCNRCLTAVRDILTRQEIGFLNLQLGEIELAQPLSHNQTFTLKESLEAIGFELLDDSKQRLIEKIKNIIIQQVHHSVDYQPYNLSEALSSKIHKDYSYLSHLFSEVEGTTIEKYFIHQKIEKVKELLVYDEMNLSEISFRLGYSSVAHLSYQFKKVTGLTPSHFKKLGGIHRKAIDNL